MVPNSPWTYLGHDRFVRMAHESGAQVRLLPMDLGQVFQVSGGLPLSQRAPQRQAYRLVELRRFSEHLGLSLNVQPRFFPVRGDDAARLLIAVDLHDGTHAALLLAGAFLAAVWTHERDIADGTVLAAVLGEQCLPSERLQQAKGADIQQRYEANTRAAIDAGVFGAPTYRVDGEMFWGQDRLDFLARKLQNEA